MRPKTSKIVRATIVAGIFSFGYLQTGCVAPLYVTSAPNYSEIPGPPGAGPEYADVPPPAQAPRSSKGDLIKMAERQQDLIRALRRRVKELENNPEEVSEQPDNLIPQEQLAPMSTANLGRTVDRQQKLVAALKARIRELEKKR